MDTDNHVFISWEEHAVYQGKGSRVVHYYLKDTSGELILAVVGTERSTRHILYVVSEDYLAIQIQNQMAPKLVAREDNKMVNF